MNRRALVVLLASAAAPGCHGCHDDHPYVPYAITTASTDAAAPPGTSSDPSSAFPLAQPEGGAGEFVSEPALVAPPGASRWDPGGVAIAAPDGQVFVLGLARDFDGDGKIDVFAIVRPAEGGNDPGRLLFYGGAAGAPVPIEPRAGLVRDPSCTPIDRLEGVGRRSVLVELGAQCPLHPSSAAARWIAVVSGVAPPAIRLAVTVADPAGAPALSIDADTSDRDADGRDDVAVRVTLEGGGAPLEPGPRVSATLAWLDRPAGLSHDAATTEASFGALATAASSRAVRTREAASVPGFVAQAKALWRAMCTEGGAPRVEGVTGSGALTCGVPHALESLGLAVVRAYVTENDPLRAALALDRAERPPASRTSSRVTEAQGWISRVAPRASARLLRAIAAVPVEPRGHEPAWSPLAFETGGKLLVKTAGGVVRVDADLGDESAAGSSDWKSAVASPDGSLRWIEAYDPCDGLPLRATFEAGDDLHDVPLPVPPALAGRCSGSRGAPARAIPIAWGTRGLEAIVEGEPVLFAPDVTGAAPAAAFLDQPVTRGAPRSPDGQTYVVPTDAGLLVTGGASGPKHARLLVARELEGTFGEQSGCVVSDDAARVACVRAGRAWVGSWDAP